MIAGVLRLAERPVVSIMTPRTEIDWLDLDDDEATLKAEKSSDLGHSRFPLARGSLDQFVGIAPDQRTCCATFSAAAASISSDRCASRWSCMKA